MPTFLFQIVLPLSTNLISSIILFIVMERKQQSEKNKQKMAIIIFLCSIIIMAIPIVVSYVSLKKTSELLVVVPDLRNENVELVREMCKKYGLRLTDKPGKYGTKFNSIQYQSIPPGQYVKWNTEIIVTTCLGEIVDIPSSYSQISAFNGNPNILIPIIVKGDTLYSYQQNDKSNKPPPFLSPIIWMGDTLYGYTQKNLKRR